MTMAEGGGVFISYRRADSTLPAAWLYEELVGHFGAEYVFKDVDSIRPGEDFVEVIRAAVDACDAVVVVIGPAWLTVSGEDGRSRLTDEGDLVRLEIETALTRGVRVLPVLVAGAGMPRTHELPPSLEPLARRNALEIESNRFRADTAALIRVLDDVRRQAAAARAEARRREEQRQRELRAEREAARKAAEAAARQATTPGRSPTVPARTARRTGLLAALAAVAVVVVVLLATSPWSRGSTTPGGSAPTSPAVEASPTIVVGSANFPENQILAEIYAQALAAKGVKVEKQLNIGSREAYLPMLQDGSVDLVPEYTGVLLQYLDPTASQTTSLDVYTALQAALPPTLTALDRSPAVDRDALVVTRATATRYNATSIADLASHCGDLVLGAAPEFQQRPDGIPGIEKTYHCTFKEFRSLDSGGPLTVAALKNGDVQVADLFTTDPSITANDFIVLEDPKNNFSAQNVVPVMTKAKATDTVRAALNAVSDQLTTQNLNALDAAVEGAAKPTPEAVAKKWLSDHGLT